MVVRVQETAFSVGDEVETFARGAMGAGAIVSFTGVVRDEGGTLDAMQIEHYPGMTERAISKIVEQACGRWGLTDALVIHRHGHLLPGEVIMMVATASSHRSDAFAAADFLMDFLKSRAPFWKKEMSGQTSSWVAAKDEDEVALTRW
ncbi:MAG: molybdenum cofactor biosynthesis protein MoaE [Pseudomonadota bacterium]